MRLPVHACTGVAHAGKFPGPVTARSHLTIYRYAGASRVFEFG